MVSSQFSIAFDFATDQGLLKIPLTADVEVHHSQVHYVVKNFHTPGRRSTPILPEMKIKRHKGRWVHTDSEFSTQLSLAAGAAIDAYEAQLK
ncbi:MAG TPA: hypothetical protein VN616_04885 [Puia sp.]|nr:hypothetical protein [Puia sp.]